MIGLDDECKKYSAEISVLDHETKAPVFKTTYQPRHISTQEWGDFCMMVPQGALAKAWKYEEDDKDYSFRITFKILKL